MDTRDKFWENKPLSAFTDREWEMLCDHCGVCCLLTAQDDETGEVYRTSVICRLYDPVGKSCRRYDSRLEQHLDCFKITPSNIKAIAWLPDRCSYKLVDHGKPLPDSHPLLSGHKSDETNFIQALGGRSLVRESEGLDLSEYVIEPAVCRLALDPE